MTLRRLSIATAMLTLSLVPATAQVREYQLKAAFLFNFAKFVEWPAEAFHSPGDAIEICVWGRNPFGDILNQTVAGKVAAGRSFDIREIPLSTAPRGCHILFVSGSDSKRFREIADSLKGTGTLTVGEGAEFTSLGGIIAFKLDHDNIRFEINVAAAEASQVRISSKLLSLAQVNRRTP